MEFRVTKMKKKKNSFVPIRLIHVVIKETDRKLLMKCNTCLVIHDAKKTIR